MDGMHTPHPQHADHSHDEDDESHHHHHHHHAPSGPMDRRARIRLALRSAVGALVVGAAVLATTAVTVSAGQADLITRFGAPMRVLTTPGLAWKLPAPFETAVPVDLRLRTTASGLQDVGTRDGLRILVGAYVAWRVPADGADIRGFVRSVRNDPDEAARQIRSFVGSALQVTASAYDLADLVNTDPAHVRLADFQDRLRTAIRAGVEARLRDRHRGSGHRAPDAARQHADGHRVAHALGARDGGRRTHRRGPARGGPDPRGKPCATAASRWPPPTPMPHAIEAASRRTAADIQGAAYARDPQLYLLLRSLDTLSNIVGPNSHLVLRTDAAPFDVLTTGPVTGACAMPLPK